MRFLVIRLSSIGDIVHALPAATALARKFPDAEVDWVVESRYAALLAGNPFLKRVLKLDTLGWRNNLSSAAVIEKITRGVAQLREASYDAALDFQGLIKSAIIAKVSRSQRRIGFAGHSLREPAAGVFYDERVSQRGRRHIIEINFSLAEHLGAQNSGPDGWEFPLPHTHEDDNYVAAQLARLEAREFIIVNPGGGWRGKRWDPVQYAELIHRLTPELDAKVLITGSPDEEGTIGKILRLANSPQAHYFPSTLVQLIALARRARLFISGDTGPMHLAAAVRTPIVAILASDDPLNTPARNGPFLPADVTVMNLSSKDSSRESQSRHYVEGVTTEAVLSAIRERLARVHV